MPDETPADRAKRAVTTYETLRQTKPSSAQEALQREPMIDAVLAVGVLVADAVRSLQKMLANKK